MDWKRLWFFLVEGGGGAPPTAAVIQWCVVCFFCCHRVYTRSCSLWARKREDRTPSSAGCVGQSPKDKGDNEANHSPSAKSSLKRGSPLELPKMDLKALFDYHARQKKRKWKKQEEALSPERKEATKCKTPRKRAKRRPPSAPLEERKRRCKERGFHFPFVKKLYGRKQIPLRMVYQYEVSYAWTSFKWNNCVCGNGLGTYC